MPILIPHVEEIAREERRDVLVVCFGKRTASYAFSGEFKLSPGEERQRAQLIRWLDDNGVGFRRCWNPALREGEWLAAPYDETIAVDVTHEPTDKGYQKFIEQVELSDGTPRSPDLICYVFQYGDATRRGRRSA